ncbi:MAG: hypothetical protein KF727_04360 [Microbacteriaceae bacterium]|nr:hypothetical protein [Microbacteriaceae bacterium]
MPDTSSDSERWAQARAVAAELAESGVDPLDAAAATAARVALQRRFLLDLLVIFGVVAVVAAVGLMVYRAFAGNDPLGGREIWIASAALAFVLIVVVVRSLVPRSAAAYEEAWARFRDRVWPDSSKGDDLGSARLAFVLAAASGQDGAFPSVAPGRKA